MSNDLENEKEQILKNNIEIEKLKAAAECYKTDKTGFETQIADLKTQNSALQIKEAHQDSKIIKISKERGDLNISLQAANKSIQEVTTERYALKSNVNHDLMSVQAELKAIRKERDSLSSFLETTAESSIALAKLLSLISTDTTGNHLFIQADLDIVSSNLSKLRHKLKSLSLPETTSDDLKSLITSSLDSSLDIKSSVDSIAAQRHSRLIVDKHLDDSRPKLVELKAKLDDVDGQFTNAKDVNVKLTDTNDDSKAKLKIANKDAGDRAKTSEELDQIKEKKKRLEEDLKTKKTEVNELNEKVKVIEALQSKFKVIEDLNTQIKQLVSEKQSTLDQTTKDLDEKVQKVIGLKKEYNEMKKQLKFVKAEKSKSKTEYESKQSLLEESRKKVDSLTAEIKIKSERITELDSTIAQAKHDLKPAMVDEQTKDLNAEIHRLRLEVKNLRIEVDLRSNNEQAKIKEIENLKASLKAVQGTQNVVATAEQMEVEVPQTPQADITENDEHTNKHESEELFKQIEEIKSKTEDLNNDPKNANKNPKKKPHKDKLHKDKLHKDITNSEAMLLGLQSQLDALDRSSIKIEILKSSPVHRLTDDQALSVDQTVRHEVEDAKDKEIEDITRLTAAESSETKLKMYLEKVFDHIALMDIDLKEKNEELASLTEDIAKAERFKDSQKAIVHILSLAVRGIKSVGQSSGVDASQEVKELEKDIEVVKKSMKKVEVISKQCSARNIILEKEHVEITVNSPKDHSPGELEVIPISEAAIEEEFNVTKVLSETQRSGSEKVHDLFERIVKAKMTNEKLTDNIAHLTFILSAIVEDLKKVENISLRNEETVQTLMFTVEALHDFLNSGDENMQRIAQEITFSLGPTSAMNSPLKHTQTPDSGAFCHNFSIQGHVQSEGHIARVNHDLLQTQSDIDKAREQTIKLAAEEDSRSKKITELQQELKTQQDSNKTYLESNKQKESETDQYQEALDKVNSILSELPGLKHLLQVSADSEYKSVDNKEGSHRSIDTGRSRDTEKRKHIIDTDKPSVKVTHTEPAPDQLNAVDFESRILKQLDKLTELGIRQNQSVDDIKDLEQMLVNIRLDGDKITENIGANKARADDLTKEIQVLTEELKKTNENLDHRRNLVKLLEKLVQEAKLLRGTEDVQAFAESTIDDLKSSEFSARSVNSRHIGNLHLNSVAVEPSTSQAVDKFNFEEVFDCIQKLVDAVQNESTNQAKAILLSSDLANQLDVDLQETLTRLMENMSDSSESFIDQVESSRTSRSIERLVQAANYILEVERHIQEQLCSLVDHIYENAPPQRKKLGYSSPARLKSNSGKK